VKQSIEPRAWLLAAFFILVGSLVFFGCMSSGSAPEVGELADSISPTGLAADDGSPAEGGASAELNARSEVAESDEEADRATAPLDTPSAAIPPAGMGGATAGTTMVAPAVSPTAPGLPSVAAPARTPPASSGLQAGFSDDNAQFNYFVDFLETYRGVPHFPFDVSERLSLQVLDSSGKAVPNARVRIYAAGRQSGDARAEELATGLTYPNGGFRFYPMAIIPHDKLGSVTRFVAEVTVGGRSASLVIERDGPRQVELRLPAARSLAAPLPLDVLFILDTTGSMSREIERLRATIEIIYYNLSTMRPAPALRFGLIQYRDRGDEYITRVTPFTSDLEAFQAALATAAVGGGGDRPEDLQSALKEAVNGMQWNSGGIRLAFVVTDADSHLDYGDQYTYVAAAADARERAIKFYTIGTGGLPLEGEYLLRQLAQLTDARYIFLTYGEQGDSGGGQAGSVSHHVGANYETDKLEAIIIRFVREEVAWLSDTPPTIDNDWFTADSIDSETRDETLDSLFAEALSNLLDYSSYHITSATTCAVLPIVGMEATPGATNLGMTSEYFSARLLQTATGVRRFTLVERANLSNILAELELQLSGLFDESTVARVGEMLGAEVLVSGQLYRRADKYELFLRLVRVSTAEVLAVTRAVIDPRLGL